MAKEPIKTDAPKTDGFVVTQGVLVTRDAKGRTVEVGPGKPFVPADDEERDALILAGKIGPAGAAAAAAAAAMTDAAQLRVAADAAIERASAAEAKAAALQDSLTSAQADAASLRTDLDKANARIAELEKAAPAPAPAPAK